MSQKSSNAEKINPKVVVLTEANPQLQCDFCHRWEVNTLMWGHMYQLDGITIHYFCLLFSAGLSQNGEDEEGILGFMPKDIQKELKRGTKLKCKYCRSPQATVGCSVKTCKASFHYPCGLEKGSVFQFIGNYESYCVNHRKETVISLPKNLWECPICFMDFNSETRPIKPPCCKNNNGVFHRKCMMEMARTSGLHFFKCPLCNDKETFCDAMRTAGVYVPDRDAAWELEPNAYSELNTQYNRCDAKPCLCDKGREYNSDGDDETKETKWKIIRCGGCGASAKHMKCGGLKNLTFRCDDCASVLAGARLQDDDSDDDDFVHGGRRRNFNGNRDISRISRRIFDSDDSESSDDESSVSNVYEHLDENIVVVEKEGVSGSDAEGSWKDIVGIPRASNDKFLPNNNTIYGRRYKPVGVELNNDTESEEESEQEGEDDEEFKVTSSSSSSSSVSIFTSSSKVMSWSLRFSSYSKSFSKQCQLSGTSAQKRKIDAFKQRLDKLRKFYIQINEKTKSDGFQKDSQVRTGLVEAPLSSRIVLNLLNDVDSVRSGPSNRVLRCKCKYPNIIDTENVLKKSSEVDKSIDKLINIFNNKTLLPTSSNSISNEKNMASAPPVVTPHPSLSNLPRPSTNTYSPSTNDESIIVLSDSDEEVACSVSETAKDKYQVPFKSIETPLIVLDNKSSNINPVTGNDNETVKVAASSSSSIIQVPDINEVQIKNITNDIDPSLSTACREFIKKSRHPQIETEETIKYFNGRILQNVTGLSAALIASSPAFSRNFRNKSQTKPGPDPEIIVLSSDDDDHDETSLTSRSNLTSTTRKTPLPNRNRDRSSKRERNSGLEDLESNGTAKSKRRRMET